jgi:hypothetical protein
LAKAAGEFDGDAYAREVAFLSCYAQFSCIREASYPLIFVSRHRDNCDILSPVAQPSFNEEQIKGKIILPLIHSLGIDISELAFETTFQIQLGRGVYTVKGETAKAAGRLDILCRRNGTPLFIIESKAELEPLTESVRRQGLTYARLLEPMAPYVILTNGIDTQIYDTVSGDRIDQLTSQLLSGFQPTLEAETNLKFEALKHFVGLSFDNLMAFCKGHNERSLSPFRANPQDNVLDQLQRKYIAATYVRRRELENRFRDFMNQTTYNVFPVVGPSGSGKTNTMCYLTETSNIDPVLFYSGTLLTIDFLKRLGLDFNLVFSPQETPLTVLKKVSAFTRIHNKTLTIFIDALDEWSSPAKAAELDIVVAILQQLGLRLVVSCKTSNWEVFLAKKGVPSTVKESLFPNVPQLSNFDMLEFESAVSKYASILQLHIHGKSEADNLLNPFALRIACEVAFSSDKSLNLNTESRSHVRRYLDLKLAKAAHPDICWRVLKAIASLMEQLDQPQLQEDVIRQHLTIGPLHNLPQDVFDHGILYRYVNEFGTAFIGFYFGTIRDYLIAIRVFLLPENVPEQINNLMKLFRSYIGESSAIYFFRSGTLGEKRACLEAAYGADAERGEFHVERLLGWHGKSFLKELGRSDREKLLAHLDNTLFLTKSTHATAEQVIDILEQIEIDERLEDMLVSWMFRFADSPQAAYVMVSDRVAKLLSRIDTPFQTERLIRLATDSTKDGYVRRYVVEALGGRTLTDPLSIRHSDPGSESRCEGVDKGLVRHFGDSSVARRDVQTSTRTKSRWYSRRCSSSSE